MLFIFSSIIFIKSFCILFTYSTVVHTYRHAHTYRPCFIHSEATNSRSINKRTCNHTIMCPNHTIATHVPSCIHIQLAIVFIQPCFVFFYSFSVWGSSMLGDKYFKIQSTSVFYSYTIYKKEKIFFCFPNTVPSASLICIGALNRQSWRCWRQLSLVCPPG